MNDLSSNLFYQNNDMNLSNTYDQSKNNRTNGAANGTANRAANNIPNGANNILNGANNRSPQINVNPANEFNFTRRSKSIDFNKVTSIDDVYSVINHRYQQLTQLFDNHSDSIDQLSFKLSSMNQSIDSIKQNIEQLNQQMIIVLPYLTNQPLPINQAKILEIFNHNMSKLGKDIQHLFNASVEHRPVDSSDPTSSKNIPLDSYSPSNSNSNNQAAHLPNSQFSPNSANIGQIPNSIIPNKNPNFQQSLESSPNQNSLPTKKSPNYNPYSQSHLQPIPAATEISSPQSNFFPGMNSSKRSVNKKRSRDEMDELAPSKFLQSKSTGFNSSNSVPKVKLERSLKTVADIWKEYEYGLNDKPPLKLLELEYGTKWRNETESRTFLRRKKIYEAIKMGKSKGIDEQTIIEDLELHRSYDHNGHVKRRPLSWLCTNIPTKYLSQP